MSIEQVLLIISVILTVGFNKSNLRDTLKSKNTTNEKTKIHAYNNNDKHSFMSHYSQLLKTKEKVLENKMVQNGGFN